MRLIDADALIKELEAMANNEWNVQVGSSKGLEDAIDVIDNAPTVTPEKALIDKLRGKEETCCGNCDSCELGVPIDGQFYEDGLPIHECSIPVKKNPRDLTAWELERFMSHGHPICDCEQKCDKCPEWLVNICENYDYYVKKYKKGADK